MSLNCHQSSSDVPSVEINSIARILTNHRVINGQFA